MAFWPLSGIFFFFPFENSNTRIHNRSPLHDHLPPFQSCRSINTPRGSSRQPEPKRCSVFLRDEARSAWRSPGAQTVSSHHKYLCCASLRPPPRHLVHRLIRTSGGSSWDVLLMNYRFSPLPRCFTMHPVYRHQIFSALWLELMHRSPPAESRLLISERKLGFNKKNQKKPQPH